MHIDPKLQLLIDNFFFSFNGQNIFCQVSDINGKIVFLNDYFEKQKSILETNKVIGKSLDEFFTELNINYYEGYLNDLKNIYQQIMDKRERKTFFAYARDKNGNEYIRLANAFPLVTKEQDLIGSYTLSWFANPFNFLINFMNNYPSYEQRNLNLLKHIPKLGRREHQILFLLIHRFSQYEIADFLTISRATVQKTITDGLMNKFNIINNDKDELINKAVKLNLHMYFPPSLLGNRLVILNNDESIIQQIANKINNKE